VGVVSVEHFGRLKNNAIVANMASDEDVSHGMRIQQRGWYTVSGYPQTNVPCVHAV
jgi:hypothetical protein